VERPRLKTRSALRLLLALCLAASTVAPAARAASPSELARIERLRGQDLARAGRCDEALPVFETASRLDPRDPGALDDAGQCLIRLGRYEEAVTSLARASALPGAPPDVLLHLGMARFHGGDAAGAASALADARARGVSGARIDFYDGMVALEQGRAGEAAPLLARAAENDPKAVDPAASYYAGMAFATAGDEDAAEPWLERARAADPGGRFGLAAERALAGAVPPARRLWIDLSIGLEYDSNVALLGNNVGRPGDISNQGDGRGVWTVGVGSELYRDRDWTVGIQAQYYGNAHFTLSDFDTHYPWISPWVDYHVSDRTTLRLEYGAGYAWVGGEGFLFSHGVTPSLIHDWGDPGVTRVFAGPNWNHYSEDLDDVPDGAPPPAGGPGTACPGGASFCGPFGLDEEDARDRTGMGVVVGVDHGLPPGAFFGSSLRGGVRYYYYGADGTEYDYQAAEVVVGSITPLLWDVSMLLDASYTHEWYRHPSSYPDFDDVRFGEEYPLSGSKRGDDVVWAAIGFVKPINRWLAASVRYSYTRNFSNVEVFDYGRHIVGAYLSAHFEPFGGKP